MENTRMIGKHMCRALLPTKNTSYEKNIVQYVSRVKDMYQVLEKVPKLCTPFSNARLNYFDHSFFYFEIKQRAPNLPPVSNIQTRI